MPSARASLVERRIGRNTLYTGRAVNFRVDKVRLPDGKPAVREYLDHPGAAAAVPFLDSGTIVLVRQYRYAVGAVTLEIPAGKLSRGERPEDCLRRELREETGYACRALSPLLVYWPTPAFANEVLHVYEARGLSRGRRAPDADEFIEVVRMPFERALRMVWEGKIRDSKTIIGLLACALRRKAKAIIPQ